MPQKSTCSISYPITSRKLLHVVGLAGEYLTTMPAISWFPFLYSDSSSIVSSLRDKWSPDSRFRMPLNRIMTTTFSFLMNHLIPDVNSQRNSVDTYYYLRDKYIRKNHNRNLRSNWKYPRVKRSLILLRRMIVPNTMNGLHIE